MSTEQPSTDKPTPDERAARREKIKRVIKWAAATLLPLILGGLGVREVAPVERRVEVPVEKLVSVPTLDEFEGIIDRHGWVPDAEAAAKDVPEFRTFADTPAGQVAQAQIPKQVFLWQFETKLTGRPTPLKDQNPEGSCVGHNTTTAIERSLAAEIVARGGTRDEFTHFSEEVTYIGSRTIGAQALGARPMNPASQGSAGVFAKAFVTGTGMVPKGKYDAADLTEFSASRAAAWRRTGVPASLVEVAKKYPVKSSAKVVSWPQCKAAITSGYSPSMCSTLSFSRQRDANGVASRTREGWNHCMCIDGFYIDPATGKEYGHVENSWSNLPDQNGRRTGQSYHTGPTGWGNPTTAGFWARAEDLDAGLREGESYAYSGVTGFPAKTLPPVDWFVRAQDRHPVRPMLSLRGAHEFVLAP